MLCELLKHAFKGAPVDFEIKNHSSLLKVGEVVKDWAQLGAICDLVERNLLCFLNIIFVYTLLKLKVLGDLIFDVTLMTQLDRVTLAVIGDQVAFIAIDYKTTVDHDGYIVTESLCFIHTMSG